jgi:hypothetical protein
MGFGKSCVLVCLLVTAGGCLTRHGTPVYECTRTEIGAFNQALDIFKHRFGSYPPSRVKLSETGNYPERDQPGTLDADSVAFLTRMWPRLRLGPGAEIDWNHDGRIEGDWTLEGDECLVFFLGGVQTQGEGNNDCCGFAADPDNPMWPPESGKPRVGPFFEFRAHRLRDLHGRGFFSYLDAFGKQPYAYFSAFSYDRYGGTDCSALGVWPYAESLRPRPRFWNTNSCQIICAGPDGRFGPGTTDASRVWTPANAGTVPPDGRDDLSNFHPVPLGVPRSGNDG